MKIGLMSDSHDNLDALRRAVQYCNAQKVAAVLHAGDLISPFVNRVIKDLQAPFTAIFGNNDGEKFGLRQVFQNKIFEPPHEMTIDNKRILMLHDPVLVNVLQESGAFDLILYGHLHQIDVHKGKNLVVNPGELCGWLTGQSTLALWDTETNSAEIVTI
jgi:uncharacterized protein